MAKALAVVSLLVAATLLSQTGNATNHLPLGLTTQASTNGAVAPGTPVTDTATFTPPPGGPPATGTVTYTLVGPLAPGDVTCTASPLVAPLGGAPQTVPVGQPSPPYAPTAVGTYNFLATYSGDVNYAAITTPVGCGVPAERFTVQRLPAALSTQASTNGAVAPGTPVTDLAVLTVPAGSPAPTGTVTYTLVGPLAPGDVTCTASPLVAPLGGAPQTVPVGQPSPQYAPTAVGTYNFLATYSGDVNYLAITIPVGCGDPAERFTVVPAQVTPNLATQASPSVHVGGTITDTATLSGGNAPTGTITFTLFGPDNAACAGPPIFASTVPVAGNGTYTSTPPFAPTAPGTYRWVATYSGDVNNVPVATACNDPNEQVVVTQAIDVQKTADPLTRPEPGGDFTYTVVVTNTSSQPRGITLLDDNVYGDLATRPNSTCGTSLGTVLAPTPGPGDTYTCTFTAPFTGNAGDSLTDVVTVRARTDQGDLATDTDDAVVSLTPVAPAVDVVKTANPLSRPAPGGDFTYTVVVTNTSTVERLTITSLTDSVYGNLATRGTCTTAIGTVLALSPGPGNTYTCQFTAPFTGNAGASLTDVVTVVGTDDDGQTATDTDDATVTLTGVPTIDVVKTADPLTRPEPGGDFTYTVVVTNTSNQPLTINSLTDNVYGNLATRPNSTCAPAIGTVLAAAPGPGNTFTCTFTAPFTGNAGASLTDIVTVTGQNPQGVTVTDTDDAVVSLTPVAPAVDVVKTANPLSRPAPGGDFTYTVVVTNTSTVERLTITSLTDSVYGNLATRGTCTTAIGTVLALSPGPGNTYTCQFTAPFTGNAGASLTDVVTVVGTDDDGQTATDTDDAIVSITAGPTTTTSSTTTTTTSSTSTTAPTTTTSSTTTTTPPPVQPTGTCIGGAGGAGTGTGGSGTGIGIGGTGSGATGTGTGTGGAGTGTGGAGGGACNTTNNLNLGNDTSTGSSMTTAPTTTTSSTSTTAPTTTTSSTSTTAPTTTTSSTTTTTPPPVQPTGTCIGGAGGAGTGTGGSGTGIGIGGTGSGATGTGTGTGGAGTGTGGAGGGACNTTNNSGGGNIPASSAQMLAAQSIASGSPAGPGGSGPPMTLLAMVAVMVGIILRSGSRRTSTPTLAPAHPGPAAGVFRPVRTSSIDMSSTAQGPLDPAATEALAEMDTVAPSRAAGSPRLTASRVRRVLRSRGRPW